MEFLEGHDLGELLKQRGVLAGAVGRRAHAADRRGARGGALARHRPSRRQADEPVRHVAPRRHRADQGPRLRHLEVADGRGHAADADAVAARHARVHVARSRCVSARLVDTRTDIWSLGTVFYEILEGRRPFEAESFSEMCVKVAVDPPAPMVNTPPALQQVILRCLAKTPEQRYANMAEFARDLVPFAHDPHQAQMLVERMTRMLRRARPSRLGERRHRRRPLERRTAVVARPRLGPGSRAGRSAWGAGSDPAARAVGQPDAAATGRRWQSSHSRGRSGYSQPYVQPPSETTDYARRCRRERRRTAGRSCCSRCSRSPAVRSASRSRCRAASAEGEGRRAREQDGDHADGRYEGRAARRPRRRPARRSRPRSTTPENPVDTKAVEANAARPRSTRRRSRRRPSTRRPWAQDDRNQTRRRARARPRARRRRDLDHEGRGRESSRSGRSTKKVETKPCDPFELDARLHEVSCRAALEIRSRACDHWWCSTIVLASYGIARAQGAEGPQAPQARSRRTQKADQLFAGSQQLKHAGKTAQACAKYDEALSLQPERRRHAAQRRALSRGSRTASRPRSSCSRRRATSRASTT